VPEGSGRPSRIDQIIPSIVEHDAVSNHTFEVQRLLVEMGFSSEIYASTIGPGAGGRVRPLSSFASSESDWVIYQCSIGSPAAEVFGAHRGRKLLDYHNITPAELVERWLPPLGTEARLGRRQLRELAPHVDYAFADSPFNAGELLENGFRLARVVPVLVEDANLSAPADATVARRLIAAKDGGGSDWLFVGQIAPHKAQHDVVKAFACYRQVYDRKARLHLVGREMGRAYREAVRQFVASVGLSSCVELPGSVPVGALAAYYETADVFVCLSDHEGFCAPIVEAMGRGVPVVAYEVAAVGGTVGDGGLLLADKDPASVAAAVAVVLGDEADRGELIARGRRRAATFTLEGARTAFRGAIREALARL
jgi:glycosyltransferase involved in cell wall biosynthesis